MAVAGDVGLAWTVPAVKGHGEGTDWPNGNRWQDCDCVLDEDGRLAVATLSPTGMTVLQESQVTTKLSWTAPTLIGRRLYIRDRKVLVAIDLDVTTS